MEKANQNNRIECRVSASSVLDMCCETPSQRWMLDDHLHSGAQGEDGGGNQSKEGIVMQYLNSHTV